jgi:hypothetical protein
VSAAKQNPHRPGLAPALGLRAGGWLYHLVFVTHRRGQHLVCEAALLDAFQYFLGCVLEDCVAKLTGQWPDNPFQVVPDCCLEHREQLKHSEGFKWLDGEIGFLLDVLSFYVLEPIIQPDGSVLQRIITPVVGTQSAHADEVGSGRFMRKNAGEEGARSLFEG